MGAKTKRASSLKPGDRVNVWPYGPGEVTEVHGPSYGGRYDVRVRPDDASKLAEGNTTGMVTVRGNLASERFELAGKAPANA